MPPVNPEILRWARETANLSLDEAAKAIDLNNAYGISGAERLAALEHGEVEPSRSILVRMAEKYRRSLLVFYLKEPPRKAARGQDFRTLPTAEPLPYDPLLDALIRDIYSRQNLVRSILEDEERVPLPYIAASKISSGVPALVEQITKIIAFDLNSFRRQTDISYAFQYLRSQLEAAGIFVLLVGDLGSYHSAISTLIFRGFAIADPIAPFIVINNQDSRAAWSFTALHEAAHLWLGHTGVSGTNMNTDIERFCNDVASEILLPTGELQELQAARNSSFEELLDRVSEFARMRKISRSMVAYRLYRSEVITSEQWYSLNRRLELDRQLAAKKEKSKSSARGPDYYVTKRHRLGKAILGVVRRSLADGVITYTKAARILDVAPNKVQPLLRGTATEGGA
jgi:Zn-dependent peptidase ImmA (M78 family)/transcriptional regulator with XRE-family HTH domain